MTESRPTFRSVVAAFTDFLTVAIHTILYERAIYPPTSFLSARKYNFAVRQNRHPKVCEWVNDAVSAIESELLKSAFRRVAVALHDQNSKVLERYVFDVSRFATVATSDLDIPLERTGPDGEHVSILPQVDMEEQFRASLSQLTTCSSRMTPLPKGCSFTVAIELKQDGQAPLGHPQPWVPTVVQGQGHTTNGSGGLVQPVRGVSAGEMVFETWIEQATRESSRSYESTSSSNMT